MTAVRNPTATVDRRSLQAFEQTTAALGRSTAGRTPTSPLGAELRSSLLLLLGVLGGPALVALVLLASA